MVAWRLDGQERCDLVFGLVKRHPVELALFIALLWPGQLYLKAHWAALNATAARAPVDLGPSAETQVQFQTKAGGSYQVVLSVDRGRDPAAEYVLGRWYPRMAGRLLMSWSITTRENVVAVHDEAPGEQAGFGRSATRLRRILGSFQAEPDREYTVAFRVQEGDASWNTLNPRVDVVDYEAGEEALATKAKALGVALAVLLAYGLWRFVRLVWGRIAGEPALGGE